MLSFEAVDWPELRRLGAAPPGYALRGWTGRAPDRLVESYAGVKARLLLRVYQARPDLVSSRVTCALANTGMRAVNRRLGFRDEQRRALYRLELRPPG